MLKLWALKNKLKAPHLAHGPYGVHTVYLCLTVVLITKSRNHRNVYGNAINIFFQFGFLPLLSMFLVYFWLACWASGTYISTGQLKDNKHLSANFVNCDLSKPSFSNSGLIDPNFFIGALFGRIFGKISLCTLNCLVQSRLELALI